MNTPFFIANPDADRADAIDAAFARLDQAATAGQEQFTIDHGTHDDDAKAFEVARKILDDNAACICTQVRRELRQ